MILLRIKLSGHCEDTESAQRLVRAEEIAAFVTLILLLGPKEEVAVVRVLRQPVRLESELRAVINVEHGSEIPEGTKGFCVGLPAAADEDYSISLSKS